jgi:hypothetical protein
MGRWIYECSAIDPRDTSCTWKVGIEEQYFRFLQSHGDERRLARLKLVKETLDDPIRIYEGWSRLDKDDSYAYVGRPRHNFHSGSIELPAPPGRLFLVFVLLGGTIDEWTWRPILAEDTPDTPQGVEGAKLIWQKPQ